MLKVEIHTRAGSDDITPATFVFPGGEVHVALPDFDLERVRLTRIRALPDELAKLERPNADVTGLAPGKDDK